MGHVGPHAPGTLPVLACAASLQQTGNDSSSQLAVLIN